MIFDDEDDRIANKPLLDANDLRSPVWRKLRDHYETKLAKLRQQNDSPDIDPVATATLRGRIAEVKHSLALGNPVPGSDGADDGE